MNSVRESHVVDENATENGYKQPCYPLTIIVPRAV
jgi:hypothetical protein